MFFFIDHQISVLNSVKHIHTTCIYFLKIRVLVCAGYAFDIYVSLALRYHMVYYFSC